MMDGWHGMRIQQDERMVLIKNGKELSTIQSRTANAEMNEDNYLTQRKCFPLGKLSFSRETNVM